MAFKLERTWQEWRGLLLFIAIMLVFRSAIADWHQVPTGSMIPSILAGDRIVVDKTAYDLRIPFTFLRVARWADPQRSDVVTFESPADGRLLVKRIIGIPGDTVRLSDNVLFINDNEAQYQPLPSAKIPHTLKTLYPYVQISLERILGESRMMMVQSNNSLQARDSFGPIEVPPDHYLVLGDNRDNSQDFRYIGFINRDLILGRANSIAFSLDYENYYVPRKDRFFRDLD
ncbi:MAG: signal peptidase I [Pseudomonadota bacterium]|nr:signal peptidase I [Pseudomonadota bacterium]